LIGGAFANMANQAQNKIRQEQDASQKEIDNYKNNGNYGQLETNLR
jgi:hypothetical protein